VQETPGVKLRMLLSPRGGQMRIVLASESQSRKRALDILGLRYEIHPSAIDEKLIRDAEPL
jgi:predicted house-cleaning NTP pyrophosphatase (Maf/HAM1 superfamily)